MLARLAREPLLHFLVLGGLLFVFSGRGGSSPPAAGSDIVLTAADIERIAAGFAKTWQRPPSDIASRPRHVGYSPESGHS